MFRDLYKLANVARIVYIALKIYHVNSIQCFTKYCDECDDCCFGTQGRLIKFSYTLSLSLNKVWCILNFFDNQFYLLLQIYVPLTRATMEAFAQKIPLDLFAVASRHILELTVTTVVCNLYME